MSPVIELLMDIVSMIAFARGDFFARVMWFSSDL